MEVFDDEYWQTVDARPPGTSCKNCGHPVIPLRESPTGYTHTRSWEGIRCQNMLCGATPAPR